jgi:hypothetical protein
MQESKISSEENIKQECVVCIEESSSMFNCENNKCPCPTYCVSCFQRYLVNPEFIDDPHCLSCRTALTNDQIASLPRKWRLNELKVHKKKILLDRTVATIPGIMDKLDQYRKNKLYHLWHKRFMSCSGGELKWIFDDKLNQMVGRESKKRKREVVSYRVPCGNEECIAFTDATGHCIACQEETCIDCHKLTAENHNDEDEHECSKEDLANVRVIKSSSRQCPSCGIPIQKISGCDQMFCTQCGTAFSWLSGNVVTGVIHNPHAGAFFRNNPLALERYDNARLNGERRRNAVDECRWPHLHEIQPHFVTLIQNGYVSITNAIRPNDGRFSYTLNRYEEGKITSLTIAKQMASSYRYLLEFTEEFARGIAANVDEISGVNKDRNEDLVVRMLTPEIMGYNEKITTKHLCMLLHKRDKARMKNERDRSATYNALEVLRTLFQDFSATGISCEFKLIYDIVMCLNQDFINIGNDYKLKPKTLRFIDSFINLGFVFNEPNL